MALSLTQAAKLSNDTLQSGVVATFAQSSPVLELLPFMPVAGNSYKYNVEETLPDVGYRDINAGYTPSEGAVEQKSESLVMLGGDVDVDKFIQQTLGNFNNQRAVQTNMKVKALAKTFTKSFFKGDNASNPLEFDGLDNRLESGQVIDNGGTELTLSTLHELMDKVDGGADVLFMSKSMKRQMQALLEGQTHYIQVGKDNFGRPIEYFSDVQIRSLQDGIIGNEVYAIRFGEQEAVSGITNGGINVADLGELDVKPVFRTRIEFYCGLAMFNPRTAAKIENIGTSV